MEMQRGDSLLIFNDSKYSFIAVSKSTGNLPVNASIPTVMVPKGLMSKAIGMCSRGHSPDAPSSKPLSVLNFHILLPLVAGLFNIHQGTLAHFTNEVLTGMADMGQWFELRGRGWIIYLHYTRHSFISYKTMPVATTGRCCFP